MTEGARQEVHDLALRGYRDPSTASSNARKRTLEISRNEDDLAMTRPVRLRDFGDLVQIQPTLRVLHELEVQ